MSPGIFSRSVVTSNGRSDAGAGSGRSAGRVAVAGAGAAGGVFSVAPGLSRIFCDRQLLISAV
jgi:hypothetical protein